MLSGEATVLDDVILPVSLTAEEAIRWLDGESPSSRRRVLILTARCSVDTFCDLAAHGDTDMAAQIRRRLYVYELPSHDNELPKVSYVTPRFLWGDPAIYRLRMYELPLHGDDVYAPWPYSDERVGNVPPERPIIPWAQPEPDPAERARAGALSAEYEAKHALELEAIAERVRAECSDSAVTDHCRIVTDPDDDAADDRLHCILVDETFAEDYAKGGARYAVLSSLVRELFYDTYPCCYGCEDANPSECDSCCELIRPACTIDPVEAAAWTFDNLNDRAD